MPRPIAKSVALGMLVVNSMLAGCSSSGIAGAIPIEKYVDEPDTGSAEYAIGVGDMLSIQVWDQPQISGRMRVRNDGRITLPLINDVTAAGKTPAKLAGDIEASLKSVVLVPKVTVVVEESKPLTISVFGEVGRPGSQPLDGSTGVAQALATAGGLTNFAHKDRVFVVRNTPKPVRIRFNYDDLLRQIGPGAVFKLRPGDVIVVE
jgi:polysaccharide biosynthesis/export protein